MDKLLLLSIIFTIILLFLIVLPTICLIIYGLPNLFYGIEFDVINALLITLSAASLSTLVLFILGTPVAYLLARRNFRFKSLIESFLEIPLVIPHTVAGISIVLTSMLLNIDIVDTFWGIVIAMTYVSSPIYIGTVRSGFESIDKTFENIAYTLGATPWKVFLTISIPLNLKNIITGILLSWARAISEVGALLIIAYFPKTIQILILEKFLTEGLWNALTPSALLLAITLTIFIICKFIARIIEYRL